MKKIRRIKTVVKQLVVVKKRVAAPHVCPFCKGATTADAAEEFASVRKPPHLNENQKPD